MSPAAFARCKWQRYWLAKGPGILRDHSKIFRLSLISQTRKFDCSMLATLFATFLITALSCSVVAAAQTPSQFRTPDIPALRSVSGKLISAPTKPQTTLRTLVKDGQQPVVGNAEFSEYQFPETSAGEFQELPGQNSLRSTSQVPGARLGTELTPWNQNDILPEIGQTSEPDFDCLLYTSPSPRDRQKSRMPSSA